MRSVFALTALLIASSGWQTGRAQGIFGLTPPRPGDLPIAPGKGPDKRLTSGSHFYYAAPSSVRSSLYYPYLVGVSRVTVFYVVSPAPEPPQPTVTVPRQRQNRDEDRGPERVPAPGP